MTRELAFGYAISEKQASASDELTPEMLRAGALAFRGFDLDDYEYTDPEIIVAEIYRAMRRAASAPHEKCDTLSSAKATKAAKSMAAKRLSTRAKVASSSKSASKKYR